MADRERRRAAGAEPVPRESTTPGTPQVPTEFFDTRTLAPDERLPAFRRLTATLFDVWALGDPAEFDVQATGHRVGSMIFNQVHYNSPARFRRGHVHCQGQGNDFFVLEAMLRGEQRLMMSGRHMRTLGGHIYLRDWAQQFDSYATVMRLDSMVIPRHLITSGAIVDGTTPVFSWSQSEPAGRQLSMLFSALIEELTHVATAEAKSLTIAFLGFLNGLLSQRVTHHPSAELGAMQHFLNARLHANVAVDNLCRHFNVSRSQVYRLFEPVGGVRNYITQARLERCFTELLVADPARVNVGDVASSWGFPEASSFSRRFRAKFDTTPSQVLGRAHTGQIHGHLSRTVNNTEYCRRYLQWFEQLAVPRGDDGLDTDPDHARTGRRRN